MKPADRIPSLAKRLLTRVLRPELVEEVLGDLDESFAHTAKTRSVLRARLGYWYQVFNYLRPFAIRRSKTFNSNYMLGNYVKVGWRQLGRQRMYSIVKMGGFALGVAASLLITLYILNELSYDRQYPNSEKVYRVIQQYQTDGKLIRWVWFQAPFAKSIKEDYPEIELVGRYNSSELFGAGVNQFRRDDQAESTYEDGFVFADQELLEVLGVKMVYGDIRHCMDEPKEIVITKKKADKYYPGIDPVGKLVVINNDAKSPMKIGGVIEDFPSNSTFDFDFLYTMTGVEFWKGEQDEWGATNYVTFIKLRDGADAKELEKKMQKVAEKYLLPYALESGSATARDEVSRMSFALQKLEDIHLYSAGIYEPTPRSGQKGDVKFVWLFGSIAFFIILIACINFINLSTAKSANRAKEVGLRKTVGSYRSSIVKQFLVESTIFSVLSFMIGLLLAAVAMPMFNVLAGKSIEFPWASWWLVPAVTVASLVVGLISGLYPAFYLSSFKPAEVLKGNFSRGNKNAFTRSSLVIFQFTTSVVLIICTVVIYRQVNHILTTRIGFDREQVVMIKGIRTLDNQAVTFKREIEALASVKSASISDFLPVMGTKRNGNSFWNEGKIKTESGVSSQFWQIDEKYLTTLGIKLTDGRDFIEDRNFDSTAVIINQEMAKQLGLKDPIGKVIENYRPWKIVGVVEDFRYDGIQTPLQPLAMVHSSQEMDIMSVKLSTDDLTNSLQEIERVWRKFAPNQQPQITFLDDAFARMFDDVRRMGNIFTTFAVLAIVVACLGLFALSAFMIEQRGKEISVRLVLGAPLKTVFALLTMNFVKLIFISIVIAVPIAWWLMTKWLEEFAVKTPLSFWIFAGAGMVAIAIALLTISCQSIKAGMANPIEKLRSE